MFNRFSLANSVLVGMAQAVSVRAERCSRMCHKDSSCRLCETNCPVKAVKVGAVGTRIAIDWDLCSYCGICINVCPTGVFGMREMSRSAFLDIYLQKATDGALKLSCKEARHTDRKKGSAVVECLGMLGVAELLYFYSHSCKEIIINSGNCKSCVNKFGMDVLKDEIAELEVMAGYFERLKDMRAKFSEDEKGEESVHLSFSYAFPPKEFADDPSLENEDVTRRGMFQLFGKNIADNAIRSAAMLSPQAIPSKTPIRLTKEIPVRRRLFLEAISSMGRVTERVIPISPYFFSQSIDSEKCTYCNICTRFCPTGALHGGEAGELLFTAAECSACGMCLISCYHKCIRPAETIDLTELFRKTVKAKRND